MVAPIRSKIGRENACVVNPTSGASLSYSLYLSHNSRATQQQQLQQQPHAASKHIHWEYGNFHYRPCCFDAKWARVCVCACVCVVCWRIVANRERGREREIQTEVSIKSKGKWSDSEYNMIQRDRVCRIYNMLCTCVQYNQVVDKKKMKINSKLCMLLRAIVPLKYSLWKEYCNCQT